MIKLSKLLLLSAITFNSQAENIDSAFGISFEDIYKPEKNVLINISYKKDAYLIKIEDNILFDKAFVYLDKNKIPKSISSEVSFKDEDTALINFNIIIDIIQLKYGKEEDFVKTSDFNHNVVFSQAEKNIFVTLKYEKNIDLYYIFVEYVDNSIKIKNNKLMELL